MEAIEGITAEEKDLSTKVLALEAARGEFLTEQGFPASISIHDILPKFSGKEREELESSAERLKDVLKECKKFMRVIRALLKQSSNYINHMIRIFKQNVPGAGKPELLIVIRVESFQSGKIADMQGEFLIMLTLVFLVMVGVSILGGFALEGGPLHAIFSVWQEYIIIFGGAIFIFLAMCPSKILNLIIPQALAPFKGAGIEKPAYLEALQLMYEVFINLKRSGLLSLEKDVSNPKESTIFTKYETYQQSSRCRLCDSLKLVINHNSKPEDVESAMDAELDAHHAEGAIAQVLTVLLMLCLLLVFGAVLGVIIAMAHIDGPPAELGHKVSAAPTGTFLAFLLHMVTSSLLHNMLNTLVTMKGCISR